MVAELLKACGSSNLFGASSHQHKTSVESKHRMSAGEYGHGGRRQVIALLRTKVAPV
jgi:hypothetical protein